MSLEPDDVPIATEELVIENHGPMPDSTGNHIVSDATAVLQNYLKNNLLKDVQIFALSHQTR
jgi:hypothetical protein